MTAMLAEVNQRTQLAGQNRFEMLLFAVEGGQRFGINVFKVREVIEVPAIRRHPGAHPYICGVAHVRERTIPVIDLAVVLGRAPSPLRGYVIVTEFNRSVQGFLVAAVERILNLNWDDVLPPPDSAGRRGFLTAVARVDDELLEVLDVEKVLADVVGVDLENEDDAAALDAQSAAVRGRRVLVVEDSVVAANQLRRVLDRLGVQSTFAGDGRKGLELLEKWAEDGSLDTRVDMVISDIEMPQMDGYTLTRQIRLDPRLAHLRVMLHSSLSGGFNQAMVDKVGADHWLPKFSSADLVAELLVALSAERPPRAS